MKQRMLGFAVAAIGLLAMPAAADPVRLAQAAPAVLPAYEIVTIVRSAGFVPLSPAMLRGANYVLRATANDGREMRLTVDARRGSIVSAVPAMPAETAMPGERLGPYERMSPPGYIPPPDLPRGVHQSGPPVVYEGDRPLIYERRPAEPVPNVAPRGSRLGARDAGPELVPPPPIMLEEGALPPPPERFPQRTAPQPASKPMAKPAAPATRAAAPPAAAPLPKPRPAASEPKPAADAAPRPTPDAAKPAADPEKPAVTGSTAAPAAAPPASSPQPAPAKVDAGSLPH